MNSLVLVVLGMLMLTAELIPAAPAPYFADEADTDDLADPDGDFQGLDLVKRSKVAKTQCIVQCLVCADYTSMSMNACATGCYGSSNPSYARAYHACNKYLHSGRK